MSTIGQKTWEYLREWSKELNQYAMYNEATEEWELVQRVSVKCPCCGSNVVRLEPIRILTPEEVALYKEKRQVCRLPRKEYYTEAEIPFRDLIPYASSNVSHH